MTVKLSSLKATEVDEFWQLAYGDAEAEWLKWNGPYFHDEVPTRKVFATQIAPIRFIEHTDRQVIWHDNQMVGLVSSYFEDGTLHRWLDVGIVLYRPTDWHQGIGRAALNQWIDWLWTQTALPHIGLTTWSGNVRMCRLAESIGFKQEARVRQVRYWQGRYWDSVKYGCLRNEWRMGTA